ncbi:MAG TPA: hypothetical protein PK264_20645 [Hyphomicrobiaceae bacterium]|nr:hypothetical protein [Hyphomicrobiaceae bacterium]
MVEVFKVNDELQWGRLVKSWATGVNHLTGGFALPAVPRTLDDLKAACHAVGIACTVPSHHKALAVLSSSEEVLVIRLPAKSVTDETHKELGNGAAYSLPSFYDDFYGKPLPAMTPAKSQEFHAARIGDYSVRMCA